ncbi:PREDICTED: fibroblast growth factor-binding protein 1 [Elephantulus edwardii]|uniref:fibroblast growth factor-binding protein 1 n=1 Tax=Elephantulus edwardii TaxID=28737 RepID=UPI0003F0DA9D|nr:PREDICTED: fibroblast growth factor-binding protein 1 [Elephantulus edwardii]
MKISSLALLSVVLLAVPLLSVEGKKERGRKKAQGEGPGGQPRLRAPRGRFRTPGQAECRWAVVQEMPRATLKVECSGEEGQFSCFFAGDPHLCMEFVTQSKAYWKQMGRTLARQANVCAEPKTVLKTKLCGKKVPAAHLRMLNSTLVSGDRSTTRKPTVVLETQGTIPAETQMPPKGDSDPKCDQDADLQYQGKLVEEYCGESWGSICRFFLSMLQDTSCS